MKKHKNRYNIVRHYKDGRDSEVIHTNMGLSDAQDHCRSEHTHTNEYWDGYAPMDPVHESEKEDFHSRPGFWTE